MISSTEKVPKFNVIVIRLFILSIDLKNPKYLTHASGNYSINTDASNPIEHVSILAKKPLITREITAQNTLDSNAESNEKQS